MIRRDYTTGCSINMLNDAADTVIWLRSVGRKSEATELYNRLYVHKTQARSAANQQVPENIPQQT